MFAPEIHEHRERLFARLQNRYKWNHVIWYRRLQFQRDGTRFRSIRDDEAAHPGQHHYGLGQIATCRAVEIEHDRKIATLAERVSDGLEERFSFLCESAKNENPSLADRVKYAANVGTVKHQVNKLSDL